MEARVACGDMLEGCMCPRSAELDGRVVENARENGECCDGSALFEDSV